MNLPTFDNLQNRREDGEARFAETRWSQVRQAARSESHAGKEALEALCRVYWPAIYSFLRQQGRTPADAEDLTQGFFSRLLADEALSKVDPAKGKFRSFLLGALQRFLIDDGRRNSAEKRGWHLVISAGQFPEAEAGYLAGIEPGLTPAQICDRRWAQMLMQNAMQLLELEFRAAGQTHRFQQLQRFLAEDPAEGDYDAVAKRLETTPNVIAVAVHRLRQRYRELVRAAVMETVSDRRELAEELRGLFG